MIPLDEFMFFLLSPLGGIDGLTLLIFIVLMAMLFLSVRPGAARRDSKRRNHARRVR